MPTSEIAQRHLPPGARRRRGLRRLTAVGAGLALVGTAFVAGPAFAAHGLVSLAGSNFEIDEDANLVADHADPSFDWEDVTEIRQPDEPTGANDDSFGQGSKEDTAVPTVVDGSIPPNKSDLLTFGGFLEETPAGDFLHLYWHRVQEPSGTTNMDFEFNQSEETSANGVTPVRTEADLLLQYDLAQGGTNPELFLARWLTDSDFNGTPVSKDDCVSSNKLPCWGLREDLTAAGDATGSINTTAIAAGDSDGLGPISPRTFGEATVDFSAIVGNAQCVSFGSAYLKSRSSDSFTAALKDFIAPTDIGLTNCAKVIVRKVTDPTGDTTDFDFTTAFATLNDGTNPTFSLADGESVTYDNVFFGNGLTVTESGPPSGWDLVDIDCSASTNITPVENELAGTATFDLTNANQIVDCTFTNQARGTIVVEKVTTDGSGAFDFTSNTLPDASFTLTTTGSGDGGKDSNTYAGLTPGTYDVDETVPANWNLTSATCDDSSDPSSIGLSAGETVTCTFVNELERGSIKIVKTRKHAADGSGDHAHEGVTFDITGGGLSEPISVQTDANGVACVTGLVVSAVAGNYTVTETIPNGYVLDPTTPQAQTAAVGEATATDCADTSAGAVKTFKNIPLTNLTVSVDSQVDGGTFSSIECDATEEDPDSDPDIPLSAMQDDPSVTINDLEPGTYTCVVVIDP
ncbi:hypothetical protein ARHIZOSPH14_22880 [Agromyces rhizosphaerae]|uniref:SpaA-like prealbumin fold domain-containing protein n=1 Tax=Agromyces rhizosphaerae TaxID=88374 RepID=A0A9W6CSB0_9MICO|nr:hypothetical protein [Agromyces rhizosphaerae]GLI28046.1 hypothetical protein ARHIZOSPH14_22880 [Agromyces rhizosphaerae]